ncbi:AbrB/MazE/SpoVT family DNA-binding domain-containing protein [Candidatus Bathyarchaeota archaeon]|nr:AbrB/MazE/SpoVT family DNA-binding domain-containing protein [Candidatus Bathyarchaeota archaeon]
MASIIEPDSSGRIVIPKQVRDELGITPETQLLLISNQKDQIILQKLDLSEITRRLKTELADTQVMEIGQNIRDEINEKARQTIEDITR